MNKRHLLSVAVSTALFAISNSSFAAQLKVDLSKATPLKFAAENPLAIPSLKATGSTFVLTTPTVATAVTTNNPYFVIVNLTGGAKFSSSGNWLMKCKTAGGGFANAAIQVVGQSEGSFSVTVGATQTATFNAGTACYISGTQFDVTGATDIGYSAVVRYKDGTVVKNVSYKGQLISFVNALTTRYSKPKNVTIDVKDGSTKFAGNTSKAFMGVVQYGDFVTVSGLHFATGVDIDNASYGAKILNSVTAILTGPTLAAFNATGGVYISTNSACTNSAIHTLKRSSGSTVTFTIPNATSAAKISSTGGYHFCAVNKGVAMEKGSISVTLKGTGISPSPLSGKPYRPILAAGTLIDFVKNGISTKVLNIPSPANLSDNASLRINNMSSQTGKVRGTLRGMDGAILGTPNVVLADLKAYETKVYPDAAEIAKVFGIDTTVTPPIWANNAWLQIDSELVDLSVQGLARNKATSTLLNMSDSVQQR